MGRVLRDSFWISYDHLGKLVAANVLWFCLSFVPMIVAASIAQHVDPGAQARTFILTIGVVCSLLTLPSASGGMAHFTSLLVLKHDAEIKDIFRGMRRYFVQSTLCSLLAVIVWGVLAVNIVFYWTVVGPRSFWLAAVLGGITIWIFAFYNVMLVYVPPLLVQRRPGVFGTFKLAALVTLDNVRMSFGLYLSVVAIVLLCCFTLVGVIFFPAGVTGVVLNTGYRQLVLRYEQKERERAGLAPLEEEDEYSGRGLRDILKPWEM
jgi:uncharacterized membrane protein YesL